MKFSLRDLFLVTVIVALALGWWADRSRLADSLADKELEYADEFVRLNNELIRERDFRASIQSGEEWLKKRLDDAEQQLLESVARERPADTVPYSQAPVRKPPKK